MSTKLRIISHELLNKDYLRLNVVYDSQPCGTIDLIAEKINFNITGKYFFKGMDAIQNIKLEYKEGALVFTFSNKKHLSFGADKTVFTIISAFV